MEHRMTALETRLDTILPTLATKTDVEALRADVEKLRLSTDAKFDELRGELRAELTKAGLLTDARFAEMRADMQKMNADIKTWTLATMITIVATMLAAIFGISQIYKNTVPAVTQPRVNLTIPSAITSVASTISAPAGAK
jgi:hypothetical protein